MEKITVPLKPLNEALALVNPTIKKNPVLPILSNALFYTHNQNAWVKATDLETTVWAKVKGYTTEQDIKLLIGKEDGAKLLSTFKKVEKEVTLKTKKGSLGIVTSTGNYDLPIEPAEDFPINIGLGQGERQTTSIDRAMLERILNKFPNAASTDDMRPNMKGLCIRLYEQGIEFVSTDSQKLYHMTRGVGEDITVKHQREFIIPLNSAARLKMLVRDSKAEKVVLLYTKEILRFMTDSFICDCRLVDYNFPNFSFIVEAPKPNQVKVKEKEVLILALERVLQALKKEEMTTAQIVINGKSAVKGVGRMWRVKATEKIHGIEALQDYNIWVNGENLANGLKVFSGSEVIFNLSNERENIRITSTDPEDEGLAVYVFPLAPATTQ